MLLIQLAQKRFVEITEGSLDLATFEAAPVERQQMTLQQAITLAMENENGTWQSLRDNRIYYCIQLAVYRRTLHKPFQPQQELDPPAVCHYPQGLNELLPVRQFFRREAVFQNFILEFLRVAILRNNPGF